MFYEIITVIGVILLAIAASAGVLLIAALVLSLLTTVLLIIFIKTNHALFPRFVLFLAGLLEAPIKQTMWLFGLNEKILYETIIDLRNILYHKKVERTPHKQKALFLPQCLRSSDCPAPLTPEGIACKSCGKCPISRIKREAEKLGYRVFVCPGSTMVYRMMKKYKPSAVIGVGCHMEVKEGTEKLAAQGIPVVGFTILRDGCVETDLDIDELIKLIKREGR
jgi:uncharacterized protein